MHLEALGGKRQLRQRDNAQVRCKHTGSGLTLLAVLFKAFNLYQTLLGLLMAI